MDRNHREWFIRIIMGAFLIASLGALSSCGGGGGGGGGGAAAPGAFNMTSPIDNDTGVSLSHNLIWTGASGAVSYTVEVTTDNSFSTVTTYSSTTIPAGTTSVLVSSLSQSTVYYWRVIAVNAAGSTTASGAPYTFTTMHVTLPAPAPGAFNMTAPANTSTSVSLSPTLVWGSSSDVANYTVEVTTDSSFNNITIYSNPTITAGTTSIVVSGLSPSTTYYWRVIAVNAIGSTASTPASQQFTTKKRGEVAWSQTSDPSGIDDQSYGIAFDSTLNYLFIVGYDSNTALNDDQWRIEKRAVSDGSLVSSFGTAGVVVTNPSFTSINSFDDARAVAADSNAVYVVGYDSVPSDLNSEWRIEKRSPATGALISAFGTGGVVAEDINTSFDDIALAIAIDPGPTGTLYVVGYASTSAPDTEWRIEARDKTNGSLISSVTSSISLGDDTANAIAIDTSEGYMYVVGTDDSFGDSGWRIEKRSLAAPLSLETTTFGSGTGIIQNNPSSGTDEPQAIALDATHMYIAGYMYDSVSTKFQWRIEKRSRSDGSLDAGFGTGGVIVSGPTPTATNAVARAIAIDASYMYVAGYDNTAGGDLEWRIEKRDLATGALDTSFGDNGVYTNPYLTSVGLWDSLRSIVVDDTYIYVSGYESTTAANSRWRIEKIVK